MSSVVDYIREYGKYTFSEKKFNEVDAAVLSSITYLDFNNIVSDKKNPINMSGAIDYFLNHYDMKKFMKRGFIQKDIIRVAKEIKDTIRYRNIVLYNYVYDVTFDKQFSALTMKLSSGEVIVAYEGTDHNLVGWEEDFKMFYKFPVPAEEDAIKYINKTVGIFDTKVIVLGHSKGGHLAMVASMFCNPFIKLKIKKVYNLDGPGLRKREIESRKFKKMEKKLEHIVPHYSFFGLLLRHGEITKSVKSRRIDLLAHSIFTWEVKDNQFLLEPLSKLSRNLDASIIMWLEQHNDIEREKIITDVFDYLRKSGISEITDIVKMKNVVSLIKNSKELDKDTKDILGHFIKYNFEYHINNISDNVEVK